MKLVDNRDDPTHLTLRGDASYRLLFENMQEGLAFCRMLYDKAQQPEDFIYLEVNEAFETLTGLKDVTGKKVTEVIPGIRESSPDLFETYGRVARTGQPEKFETYVESLDIWFSISAYSPQKEYFVAVFDVITKRKQAESEIRSLAKFPGENPDPVLRVSGEGVLLYANASSQPLLNLWQCPLGQTLPDPLRQVISESLMMGLAKKVEIKCDGKDLSLIFAPIPTTNYVNVYGSDITERRQADERLTASEIKYRHLFEAAKDGILILHAETGEITDINPYLIEMLGYSHTELLGRQLWEIGLFKDIAANKDAFLELQKERYVRYDNLPLETRAGQSIWVEFVSNTYDVNGVDVMQCNVRDITARRQAALELATKNDQIKAITQQLWQAAKLATMGELAASIAHELNNPLQTVSLHIESALEALPADSPQRASLQVVEHEIERMATLVANLLQFSRRSTQQVSTLDLRAEIETTLELIQPQLRRRQIAIVREFASDLPALHADRQQLRQVFLNLFSNASDAMPDGGTLTIRLSAAEKLITSEVSDTGQGIAPEDLAQVEEPFFTTKSDGKGTGLGLAICRRIVQEHGGSLDIASQGVGQGATVRVRWPAAPG